MTERERIAKKLRNGDGLHIGERNLLLAVLYRADRDHEAMEGYVAEIWGMDSSNHIHLPLTVRLKPGTPVTVLIPADAILASKEE